MNWQFDLATESDDPAIRRLLATSSMPGSVAVTFEREPNYFLGCAAMGHPCQVVVARSEGDDSIAAIACRAARRVFINGREEEVGYLGQLRVDESFRGRWLLSRGFDFMRKLHCDNRVSGYLAAITEENIDARALLVERRRRHFPVFRESDRISTLALMLRRRRATSSADCEIRCASAEDLPAIVAFLREQGARKQFFPCFRIEDFSESEIAPGFRVEDFILACRRGEIVGALAVWDQSAYKQTVVREYTGTLRWTRPLFNAAARVIGAKPLPPRGGQIRSAYASFICIAENDAEIFHALLRQAYNLAARRGFAYLMVGLSARDPLIRVARQYLHISYHSRLYTVCWQDEGDFHARLDSRIPYVEIATL